MLVNTFAAVAAHYSCFRCLNCNANWPNAGLKRIKSLLADMIMDQGFILHSVSNLNFNDFIGKVIVLINSFLSLTYCDILCGDKHMNFTSLLQ